MTALLENTTTPTTGLPAGEAARFLSAPTTHTLDGAPVARTWVWSADGERFTLSCWEMALALVHSGAHLHLHLPAEEIADLVVRGVRAVGGPEALAAMQRADQVNNQKILTYAVTAAEYRRARKAWWPTGNRQAGTATLLAATLSQTARQAMFPPPGPETADMSLDDAWAAYCGHRGPVLDHSAEGLSS